MASRLRSIRAFVEKAIVISFFIGIFFPPVWIPIMMIARLLFVH